MFCFNCETIVLDLSPHIIAGSTWGYGHGYRSFHASVLDLDRAARRGCELCSLICEQFQEEYPTLSRTHGLQSTTKTWLDVRGPIKFKRNDDKFTFALRAAPLPNRELEWEGLHDCIHHIVAEFGISVAHSKFYSQNPV